MKLGKKERALQYAFVAYRFTITNWKPMLIGALVSGAIVYIF